MRQLPECDSGPKGVEIKTTGFMIAIYTVVMSSSLRTLSGHSLIQARVEAHHHTLDLFRSMTAPSQQAEKTVPVLESVNPPLWEFGHVAWFNEYWTARNPHRAMGAEAITSGFTRSACGLPDEVFNSAILAHRQRWDLPEWTHARIDHALHDSHHSLMQTLSGDDALGQDPYFHRLTLAHELMHAEAFRMTGVNLGVNLPGPQLKDLKPSVEGLRKTLSINEGTLVLAPPADEFWFDNEGAEARWQVQACEVDARAVTHGEYWAFVQSGGYRDRRHWSPQGWDWVQAHSVSGPRQLMQEGGSLLRCWQGEWQEVPEDVPMMLVSAFEAEAWCRWSGGRLPTEGEWLAGAKAGMRWGDVWEWTADAFLPFSGFRSHPYQEYSAPWFGDHRLLKGSSWITSPLLRDARFRNFYRPHRNDVFAGFRSVRAVKSA